MTTLPARTVADFFAQANVARGMATDNDPAVAGGTWSPTGYGPADAMRADDDVCDFCEGPQTDGVCPCGAWDDRPGAIRSQIVPTHTCGTCNGTHSGYAVGSPEYVSEHARMAAYVARGKDVWSGDPDTDKVAAQDARVACTDPNSHWYAGVHLANTTPMSQTAGVHYCPTCTGFGTY